MIGKKFGSRAAINTEATAYHPNTTARIIHFAAMAFFLAALLGGCQSGAGVAPMPTIASDTAAPPFCEPVKQAYTILFGIESQDLGAHERAAQQAAQKFGEAANMAPPEVTSALRGLAAFYKEAAQESDEVGLKDIQNLLGDSNTLRQATEARCGFSIGALPR